MQSKRFFHMAASFCLLMAAQMVLGLPSANAETKAERDQRMQWFRDAKFGLFIHWGVYSVPAGEWKDKKDQGEWILYKTKMPVSEYEIFRDQFNPVKFDAKQWVKMAKDAGMKYIVITSKHHDGFAMFDTKLTDWSIMSTPYKHDPLKDLSAACKDAGITFCCYHSILDWHHPDYKPRIASNDVAKGEPDYDRYVAFMKGQLKELVTNYGPLGIIWFDGEWDDTWTQERGKDLYAYCRSLQPNVIVNNRVGKNRGGMKGLGTKGKETLGDYGTPEQEIPDGGLSGIDWESCITMNNHWGYNKNDKNWKSSTEMIQMLIDITSKGGNYLLNVGPTAEGLIPEESVQRLAEIGKWIKVNGESIYGTTAGPFSKAPAWGRATQKPGKLYLHVFTSQPVEKDASSRTEKREHQRPNFPTDCWPKDGKLTVSDLSDKKVTSAYLLADPQRTPINVAVVKDGIELTLPSQAPDPVASVIVLEVSP